LYLEISSNVSSLKEDGIYVLDKFTGVVKFCTTVDKDTLITACKEDSDISGYPLKKNLNTIDGIELLIKLIISGLIYMNGLNSCKGS
jgi:hypothetical protein